jgi:hypothetical protein
MVVQTISLVDPKLKNHNSGFSMILEEYYYDNNSVNNFSFSSFDNFFEH